MEKTKEEELLELAKFYFLNSKFDEAKKVFDKVLEINSLNSQACCNLGLIYEYKKDYEQAKQMYKKTLDIDETNKVAKEHLDKITGLDNE
jgi:tetratricopeptide (TPR) repeat protein